MINLQNRYKMKKYTKEEFLKAAELGEVSMIDAKHVVSLLDEAQIILKGEELYEFVEDNRDIDVCKLCTFGNKECAEGKFLTYPCTPNKREDGKEGYWKKKV